MVEAALRVPWPVGLLVLVLGLFILRFSRQAARIQVSIVRRFPWLMYFRFSDDEVVVRVWGVVGSIVYIVLGGWVLAIHILQS